MRISFVTLGCKTNQYESEKMAQELSQAGFEVSFGFVKADVFVLNTCSVTAEADKKSRQLIAKCNKLNKNASIIVCGCSSQNSKEQFLGKPNVKVVFGTANKFEVVKFIKENYVPENSKEKTLTFHERRYVKIQDGCNNFCTYCIIPHLRGREKSRKIVDIVKEIKNTAKTCKEVVLTGINISAFGRDYGKNLTDLITELKDVDVRLRLGSLEARVIDENFLKACKNLKAFCPHFHLSMQSGCDEILKKMNRHYTKNEFIEKVKLIRKHFKNAFIACDLIVGFPTETDKNFNETLKTIKKIKFSYMHIFPYSKREGTLAAKMDQVPAQTVNKREEVLKKLNDKFSKAYIKSLIGKELEVLVEKQQEDSCCGFCREYVMCYLDAPVKEGEIVQVRTENLKNDGLFAKICLK